MEINTSNKYESFHVTHTVTSTYNIQDIYILFLPTVKDSFFLADPSCLPPSNSSCVLRKVLLNFTKEQLESFE